MNKRDIFTFLVLLLLYILIFSKNVLAHPGNTASDGCHYCWTNCSYWGEIYGTRHCHSGYTVPVVQYKMPDVRANWSTHYRWSDHYDIKFYWSGVKEAGFNGVSVFISQLKSDQPDNIIDTYEDHYTFYDVEPGKWYVSMKAVKNGIVTSNYVFWDIYLPKITPTPVPSPTLTPIPTPVLSQFPVTTDLPRSTVNQKKSIWSIILEIIQGIL